MHTFLTNQIVKLIVFSLGYYVPGSALVRHVFLMYDCIALPDLERV